jgi:hypothetical protein
VSTDAPWLEQDRQRRQRVAKQSFTEAQVFEWLMREEIGRHFLWQLIDEARVLAPSLANNTATVQSAIVAVRDFAMGHLLQPALRHCPRLFLEMKQEHESDGRATKPN